MIGNKFSLKALGGNTVKFSVELKKKIEIEPNLKNNNNKKQQHAILSFLVIFK